MSGEGQVNWPFGFEPQEDGGDRILEGWHLPSQLTTPLLPQFMKSAPFSLELSTAVPRPGALPSAEFQSW